MAKKQKTFAEKVASSGEGSNRVCPTCGETLSYVQQVKSVQNSDNNSWKFNQKMVAVCSCNKAEVLG
jgi:hypothetical protein